jgi:dCMP deaminase
MHDVMMQTARLWSKKSYCKRSQVGAILEKDGRILGTGYNGTLVKNINDCEDSNGNTRPNVVHAEQNLIAFAARHGIATIGCTVYVTLSPCEHCAKLLVQAGITKVVYDTEYRDTTGLILLSENGVEVVQYVDWD